MKIQAEIEVTNEQITDQIITALEGGSNYWYEVGDLTMLPNPKDNESLSELIARAVLDGISVPVYDVEEPDEVLGHLTRESIENALKIMAKDHPDHFTDVVQEQGDADTADVFLQLSVMKEIVFG